MKRTREANHTAGGKKRSGNDKPQHLPGSFQDVSRACTRFLIARDPTYKPSPDFQFGTAKKRPKA